MQLVLQKSGAASHRGTVDRPGQVAQNPTRDPRIIQHRQSRRFRPRRVESRQCPLCRTVADAGGIIEISQIDGAVVIVVPLHIRAGTGDRRRGNRMAAAGATASEARRRHQRQLGPAEACLGTFGIGNAVNRHRGIFGRRRPFNQVRGCRHRRIFHVKVDGFRRGGGVRQPGEWVLRHDLRHGNGTLRQPGKGRRINRRRRYDRNLLAKEYPQPQVLPLRAFNVLGLAQPAGHRKRRPRNQHGIGRVRSCPLGLRNQIGEEGQRVGHGPIPAIMR